MKITEQQYSDAIKAAMEITAAGPSAFPRYQAATSAILAALGIEVEHRAAVDETLWVPRTWIDVREGDIVRPPGQGFERHAAIVAEIGPVTSWHAAPNASQYRPNESPLEWSARRVTLIPLTGGGEKEQPFTPEHGMKPDAGVEIKVTREELNAIEALGGWNERIGVYEK